MKLSEPQRVTNQLLKSQAKVPVTLSWAKTPLLVQADGHGVIALVPRIRDEPGPQPRLRCFVNSVSN